MQKPIKSVGGPKKKIKYLHDDLSPSQLSC